MLNFIRSKGKFKVAVIAGLILLILFFIIVNRHGTYQGYKLVSETARQGDTDYEIDFGQLICYNGEGISALNDEFKPEWNVALNMANPKIVKNNGILAVFDAGGRNIVIINAKDGGKSVKLEMLSDIICVDVSAEGKLAVLMQEDNGYKIQIINPYDNDKIKAEVKTYAKDGFALTLALSDDGAGLVTVYIKNSDKITSTLTFYNFDKAGENLNADRIVGIFPYEDTLFPKLKFTGNKVCAFGDNKIVCFEAKREPKLLWEKDIKNKIMKLSADKNGFAFNEDNKIFAYKFDGSAVFEGEIPINIKRIRYNDGEVIAYSADNCVIYDGKNEKYKDKFPEKISEILPINSNTYYVITDKKIKVIKLKE